MLLMLLSSSAAFSAPPCTHANKQIALYLDYGFEPTLAESPATDISVGAHAPPLPPSRSAFAAAKMSVPADHIWNSTADMRRFGKNGVYAAQPIGFGAGVGGYFGSQADGDPSQGGLLFSIWDKARGRNAATCSNPDKAPNSTWCGHLHAFPLSDNCHRHCLDCGLHPGWHNTSGTQCSVKVALGQGDAIRFRLQRTANGTTLHNPLGMGIDYIGSEWTLTGALTYDITACLPLSTNNPVLAASC